MGVQRLSLASALVALVLVASPAAGQNPKLDVQAEAPASPLAEGEEGTLTLSVRRVCSNLAQVLPAGSMLVDFQAPSGVTVEGPASLEFEQHVCADATTGGGPTVTGTYAVILRGLDPATTVEVPFSVTDGADGAPVVQPKADTYRGSFVVASADDPGSELPEDPRAAGVDAANQDAAGPVGAEDAPGSSALLLVVVAMALVALRRRVA